MIKSKLTVLFLSAGITCVGQNLIPNGDFEQHTGCPSYVSQLNFANFWQTANAGTTDYYHQCGTGLGNVPFSNYGYQFSRSGDAYGGIITGIKITDYSEYLETPLSSSLLPGACYHFEMYLNLANIVKYTSDDIGVYFSDTLVSPYSSSQTLTLVPQIVNPAGNYPDTLSWMLVSGDYTAHGGENYIVIGNFNVSMDYNFVDSTAMAAMVYFYVDDVSLIPCPAGISEFSGDGISVYPSPAIDQLTVEVNNNEPSCIIIYDVTSRILIRQEFRTQAEFSLSNLASGIYVYEVRSNNGKIKKGKFAKK